MSLVPLIHFDGNSANHRTDGRFADLYEGPMRIDATRIKGLEVV